ncbi:Hypothetical protein SRAE_X000211700 [Strongyloides ratti]|uniref:Uncharacterized protein n=1 Tax=Strongyloides ratti TaxID=34506 RepID=A0A090KYS5_STRRB|nr:Hypothetical protein SRAE_X000211700 [Strongyloides ratti]CEF60379.1 Hypothetical protein SRAE_X000211700 [Strongyloides ratti]
MWKFFKILPFFLISILINKVKNENIACLLYSQCEARARYEEQLCVGHEWRKPTFLMPSFPTIITNKSKCYVTLKPEFDAIERLENEMYEEYKECLNQNLNKNDILRYCNSTDFSNRNYTKTVDPPISCFIGKLRIEQQCGDLKMCCPSVSKCSRKRRNSNIINKILDLHKQLKSQIAICKTSTKNKRRRPHKPDYNNQLNKNNKGRLNIRIGNSLPEFDENELLSNLKQAPKEGKKYVEVKNDVETINENNVFGDRNNKESKILNFVEEKKLISNNITLNNHKDIKIIDKNEKESSSSKIFVNITNESETIDDKDNDDSYNITKKILCPKTNEELITTHVVKNINDNLKDEWFNKKSSNQETQNIHEKNLTSSLQNIVNKTYNSKIKMSEENKTNIEEKLEDKKVVEENDVIKNSEQKKVMTENNVKEESKEKTFLKKNNIEENSKQKEVINERNLEIEKHLNKNLSIDKEEKGEVSNPFLLLLNKFQKIQFPKLNFTTEFPPHLEMVTKDTHLTFENVTSKKTLLKNDNVNFEHFDSNNNDKSYEKHNKIYKELKKSNNNNESTDNSKKNVIKNTIDYDKFINEELINKTFIEDNYFSHNSSKEQKYEDNYEKSEYTNIINIDNKKEEHNNKHSEKNQKNIKSKLHEIDGLDIMRKEYQDHLQKIITLKKDEEKNSFFKLNGARKTSHEERNEELVEMTEINNNEDMFKKNNEIILKDNSKLKRIAEIVKNCKSRYAGAVKILDNNTKPLCLKNSFINWKKTLDERLTKVKEDKTINIEEFNKFYNTIENETNEIAKLVSINENNEYDEIDNDSLFDDIICQPLTHDDNYYNTKTFIDEEDEDIVHTINNSNYKESIEKFKKAHSIAYNFKIPNETRFFTSCDHYVKCRSHINLLLDKCSSLIYERPVIPSTESILLSNLNMCGDLNTPLLNELYGLYIKRNMNLRSCLKKHDDTGGSTDICSIKSNNLISITKEIINDQESQLELGKCFSDVNKLQNKCYQMSKCCTEYEECRKSMNNIKEERRIIYLTAKITENNQNCLEKYERKFLKFNK